MTLQNDKMEISTLAQNVMFISKMLILLAQRQSPFVNASGADCLALYHLRYTPK